MLQPPKPVVQLSIVSPSMSMTFPMLSKPNDISQIALALSHVSHWLGHALESGGRLSLLPHHLYQIPLNPFDPYTQCSSYYLSWGPCPHDRSFVHSRAIGSHDPDFGRSQSWALVKLWSLWDFTHTPELDSTGLLILSYQCISFIVSSVYMRLEILALEWEFSWTQWPTSTTTQRITITQSIFMFEDHDRKAWRHLYRPLSI